MISPLHESILLALAQFKYLTTSQLTKLGLSTNKRSIANALRQLREPHRQYVRCFLDEFRPGIGRLETFHFLSAKGKRCLQASQAYHGAITLHTGTKDKLPRDYFHRKYTLDIHTTCVIQATRASIDILHFDRYFDGKGNNRILGNLQATTKIHLPDAHIIADATCLLQQGKTSRLFAIELHHEDSPHEVIKQIYQHLQGIRHSSLSANYNLQKGHRLLSIYVKPTLMQAVLDRISLQDMKPYVLFKTLDQLEHHFFEDWKDMDGKRYGLLG